MPPKGNKRLITILGLDKIRSYFKGTWLLLRKNWKLVIPYLIIYSIFNIMATSVIVKLIVDLTMRSSGLRYISSDNVSSFLLSPFTILSALFLFMIIAVIQLGGIASVMYVYSMSRTGKKPTVGGMIAAGLNASLKCFDPGNWTIFLITICLLPLTKFFSMSFTSIGLFIPGFISEYIKADQLYNAIFITAITIMILIDIVYIFAMNYHVLGEPTFASACRRSRRLIKGRLIRTIVFIFAVCLVMNFGVTGISSVAAAVIVRIRDAVLSSESIVTSSSLVAEYTMGVGYFIGGILVPAVNIAALTNLFFEYSKEDENISQDPSPDIRDLKLKPAFIVIFSVGLVLVCGFFFYSNSSVLMNNGSLNKPEVGAHRGDSVNAPENSMAAFELAAAESCEWVELDVHMTRDDVVVVSHDDDLFRICGKHIKVSDSTFDEIRDLEVGSWFREEYDGMTLSTLDEVLRFFRDYDIMVQIEIKPVTGDFGLEERVLEIVNACGMHDRVLIISLSPDPIIKMKELDPSIKTAYCMVVAMGDLTKIPYSDWFTVEESNVTPELVEAVHAKGSKIFCWTVNDDSHVQYLVDCRVDGILTDNPPQLISALDQVQYSGGLLRLMRMYLSDLGGFKGMF